MATKETPMSNEVSITINGKMKTLRGWPATMLIFLLLVLAGVGLFKIAALI